jgi:hypothetical protein
MPHRWNPTSTFTRTSTSRPARRIASDQPYRVERIGESDVLDPGSREYFRFAELRAADANGARGDLPPRHDDALVGFRVWP